MCVLYASTLRAAPNDLWWHLKAGELIAHQGIPTTNLFAWTLPADASFTYQSWLGEWLLYQLYAHGGLPLVVFARNLLAALTLGCISYNAWWRGTSWLRAAFAVVLATAMASTIVTPRPQIFAWLPCALTSVVLARYVRGELRARALALLPPLILVWVNVHGSFVLGLLLIAAYIIGETVAVVQQLPGALPGSRLHWLYLVAAATTAATLLNPLGWQVYSYVNALVSNPAIRAFVTEWQPPRPSSFAGVVVYGSSLLVLGALWRWRGVRISDAPLVIGLMAMAFSSVRHVIWYAIVAAPILVSLLPASTRDGALQPATQRGRRGSRSAPVQRQPAPVPIPLSQHWKPIHTLVAALLLVPLILVQPWLKPLLPWPASYRAQFADLPQAPLLASADTPVAAAEHLAQTPCAGRLYNELGAGSYLD